MIFTIIFLLSLIVHTPHISLTDTISSYNLSSTVPLDKVPLQLLAMSSKVQLKKEISLKLQNIINFNNTLYKKKVNKITATLLLNLLNEENIIHYDNIYNFALMSYNSYININDSNWYSIPYNTSKNISIDPDTVKAYLFSDIQNDVHVIAIKGTSIDWLGNKNVKYDKFNDNLFLSCCYYKQSSIFTGNYTCNIEIPEDHICSKECYEKSRNYDINYLNIIDQIGLNLENILDFNKSTIYFTGHSLGAILATYLGLKYNKTTIGFESPGNKHYFDLANVDKSNYKKIYHFGHNADIIFTGKCNGKFSLCYIGGYIIRTKCQVGYTCMYDSINKLNISESIMTHRMKYLIDNIIPNWKDDPPECTITDDCKDCEQWSYI